MSDLGFFVSDLGIPWTTKDFAGGLRICQDYLSLIHSAKVHRLHWFRCTIKQHLRTYDSFSDLRIKIVNMMRPKVALRVIMNIFWFYLGQVDSDTIFW